MCVAGCCCSYYIKGQCNTLRCTILHIHELTNAHDSQLSLWLTAEKDHFSIWVSWPHQDLNSQSLNNRVITFLLHLLRDWKWNFMIDRFIHILHCRWMPNMTDWRCSRWSVSISFFTKLLIRQKAELPNRCVI